MAQEAEAEASDPENGEEDDETGQDALQMWLEEITAAELASESVILTAVESDNDYDLEMRSG